MWTRPSRLSNFYPRPPRGGRQVGGGGRGGGQTFLSTPSARRATFPFCGHLPIFVFLSTPSARRATRVRQAVWLASMNFYPRPPRGGRRPSTAGRVRYRDISIHALREEGDDRAAGIDRTNSYFYPRPPRGGRLHSSRCQNINLGFLSTPSARRATASSWACSQYRGIFLSTPSARRATAHQEIDHFRIHISIHALREEGDDNQLDGVCVLDISIHALREEGDDRLNALLG